MSQCAWVPARRLYISAVDELITIIPSACTIRRKVSLLLLYLHLLGSQKEPIFLNLKKKLIKRFFKSYHTDILVFHFSLTQSFQAKLSNSFIIYLEKKDILKAWVLAEWLSLWSHDQLHPTAVVSVASATGLQIPFFSLQSSTLWGAVGRRCPELLIS